MELKVVDRFNQEDKTWAIFSSIFLDQKQGGSVRFDQLFKLYQQWATRNGMLCLSNFCFSQFLIGRLGLNDKFIGVDRYIYGYCFKDDGEAAGKSIDPIFTSKVVSICDRGGVEGTFSEVAGILEINPRSLRNRLLECERIIEDKGYVLEFLNKRTNKSRASVRISGCP